MIRVHSLTKRFGDFIAVNDVSFEVAAGEIFAFLGPNGAGKTTTIRMLTTLLSPTSGTLELDGLNPAKKKNEVRQRFGIVFQDPSLDQELSAWENMDLHGVLYHVPRKVRHERTETLLRAFELWDRRDDVVKLFSGGMRRRLEIARGLVHRPNIFFLDEPTTGLDPVSRVAVWEMITSIKEKRNLTVLITTHYMDEADRLCDRIAIVDHGKLVALDSPMSLKNSVPGSSVIEAQFLNAPNDWEQRLQTLNGVTSVQPEGASMYRILTQDGSRTTTDLVETAVKAGVVLKSLTVQSTTLDDVFVHYTGRQLRDQIVDAPLYKSPVNWE
jgi:ABC-2 type transport system ATP-binding protein